MYSNGPNMPLAQQLTMLNRSYNQDMAPPTVVGQGQQKEAAAAIRSLDEASNQENFAQGSAGDFTQNKTDEQKFYKFATHDNKHRDRDTSTMGSGGDEPHAAGLKQQQQYTVGCTTPLKGILVRSGTQSPHPLTKLTNPAANASQSSGPLKQHPAAALASVLSKSQGSNGNGSSVLAAFNQNQKTPDAGGPKQPNAAQNSFPLKKLPQAALTSVLSKSQCWRLASSAVVQQTKRPVKMSPAVDFRKSQGSEGEGSSVVCSSQSAAGLLKKMPDAITSVLTRTGCSAGTKGQLSSPAAIWPTQMEDSPLEEVISSPVASESPAMTRPQLIPTIALKKRSIETVKLPVQRDAVDRPRVPPQDDWNVHVKFTSKRNRGRKSSPKEILPKTSAKKNCTKVTVQPPNLTQSAPWNVVACGSWNASPAAAEAAPAKRERPPMAAAMAVSKTAAAPTQPQVVARVPATITATVPGVATSWNLVARKSCHKALATKEESQSQQPAAKVSGEAASMAQPWPAAKEEPQPHSHFPVRESSSVALKFGSAPPRPSRNLIAEVQRRRSMDPCSSSSSCFSSSRDSRVNSKGRNSRRAIRGRQSPELQCPEVKGSSQPGHTALMPKTLGQMKVPLPVPVPAPALVLKRSNNSASILSQIEALTPDSECSDQEGYGRDSGSEYGLEETEEEQQEQQAGEEAEEEDESEESVPQHPLNNEWTMWYVEPDRAKTWEQTLHQITSFKTVENFWSLYYHIKTPSQIKIGSDYCMFKAGVRPMWEDEANVKGGRWIVSFPKSATGDLNFYWEYSLLSLIGEFCEHSPDLCGAVVNIRQKADKIALWTADGSNEEGILEIGRQLRHGLPPRGGYALQYQLHSDSMVQQGSVFKSIYTL